MKRIHLLLLTAAVLGLLACSAVKKAVPGHPFHVAGTSTDLPQPLGYISDYEGIFSDEAEKGLTAQLSVQEKTTGDQIAVVVSSDLVPYRDIDTYARALMEYWQIGGRQGTGVLIAFGKDLRRIRIQNGPGVTARLTDEETQRIIDEIIIPTFRKDQYLEGLSKGIHAIQLELNR